MKHFIYIAFLFLSISTIAMDEKTPLLKKKSLKIIIQEIRMVLRHVGWPSIGFDMEIAKCKNEKQQYKFLEVFLQEAKSIVDRFREEYVSIDKYGKVHVNPRHKLTPVVMLLQTYIGNQA